MTIYSITQYAIDCDNCANGETNNQGDFVDDKRLYSLKEFMKVWRRDGWSIGKKTLCPTCAQKRGGKK